MRAAAKKTEVSLETSEQLFERISKEVESKRLELCESLNTEVHSFCFALSKEDRAIAYLREPSFAVQKMAMDATARGSVMDAAELILNTSIIKEESDSRIWEEDAEERNPKLRLGAIMRAKDLVSYYSDIFKKK